MTKVNIKNTELFISPINFGGNVLGWTLDEKQSFEILDAFTDGGGVILLTPPIPTPGGTMAWEKLQKKYWAPG